MQFQSITGQKETKEQLVQLVQHNRLSHALLFLGKEGSGALQLALAFAQYIVCNPQIKEVDLFAAPEPQTPSDRVIRAGTNNKHPPRASIHKRSSGPKPIP